MNNCLDCAKNCESIPLTGKEDLYNPSEDLIDRVVENQERSKRIYHYTSLETLYKLVDGVKDNHFTFYAGSIYTMNDSQEMNLGYEYP